VCGDVGLIQLLIRNIAFRRERPQSLRGPGGKLVVRLRGGRLLTCNRRTGALRRDGSALCPQLCPSQGEIGLSLCDVQLVGQGIDLKQQCALLHPNILTHTNLDDPPTHGGSDMHDIRVDRGVARGGMRSCPS
jgi:hypothetical protein